LSRLKNFLIFQIMIIFILPFSVVILLHSLFRKPRKTLVAFLDLICAWYFGSLQMLIDGKFPDRRKEVQRP